MALNLKNDEVEALATEVAAIAKETKTEAIRKALLERKERLTSPHREMTRSERAAGLLREFRATLPKQVRGKRMSRKEEDAILGYGPRGV